MDRRARRLIGALLLSGCEDIRPPDDSVLPTQLSLLVEEFGGGMLSAVVDLRRNTRHQIDVRVSEGLRLFDGRRLWEIELMAQGSRWGLRARDLLGGGQLELPVGAASPPEIAALNRNQIWVRDEEHIVRCSLDRPSCGPAAEAERPPLDHAGPGAGFHLRLVGDEVLLVLPQDGEHEGDPILEGVERIVGVHWVHEGFLQRDPVLDRTFRGRATLVAGERAVNHDGDLGEWVDAQPLVVDSAWQIEEGAPSWTGPRDASFSVTASSAAGRLCLAGRTRDDEPQAGDALELIVGPQELMIPLDGSRIDDDRVRVGPESFGFHFEVCVDESPDAGERVPFAAVLRDVDRGSTTVLTTSPLPGGTPTGWLRRP